MTIHFTRFPDWASAPIDYEATFSLAGLERPWKIRAANGAEYLGGDCTELEFRELLDESADVFYQAGS